jgi:hypothetical protein
MNTEERLWTKQDVADYLGVHVRTVENMAIPRIPIPISGKRPLIRFDPVQVKEWVDAKRTRKLEHDKTKAAKAAGAR